MALIRISSSMFLFLVVAVVSVVYAASLVEDKPLKEAADSNRVFEFLYTANTSQPCNGTWLSFISASKECPDKTNTNCVKFLSKGMKSYCSKPLLGFIG